VAIRRCPYCKAIIDESQKYCNNCGTQLLFPDEEVGEEDLKGEKVLDDDFQTSSEEDLEASLEPADEEEAEIEKEEIDLEEVIHGGGSLPGEEDRKDAEAVSEELLESEEKAELPEETPEEPEDLDDEIPAEEPIPPESPAGESKEKEKDILQSAEDKLRAAPEPDLDLEGEEEGEEEPEEKELTANGFDGDPQAEIDRILAELGKKKAGQPSPEKESAGSEVQAKGDLPPWAKFAKDNKDGAGAEEEESEDFAADAALAPDGFAPGDTMDFQKDVMKSAEGLTAPSPTMGIPESVTRMQEDLPFLEKAEIPRRRKRGAGPDEKDERDEIILEDKLTEDENLDAIGVKEDESGALPKLGFFGWIKAVAFDLLFVALFWAVAVGLAAGLMRVGLFPLLREAAVPVGLLFLALLTGYFFLFLFFLGETLGRRLVASKD